METRIKKLIELAKSFADYSETIGLLGWNTLTPEVIFGVSGGVDVYRTEKKEWEVGMQTVSVTGYSEMIRFPWNATIETLDKIILESTELFEGLKIDKEAIEKTKTEQRAKRIAELEYQLAELKGTNKK